ncbi:hypothetical protein [Slackia exigua]|uniref:hypothetical protein n=1 Tax=Slackia exigua TaxID=84109 RepID=UPI002109F8D3|nr:hypothetical protein [Slackia exigua]MCQ5091635.1 hypothetical protein [Slackia exigua]
MSKATKKMLAVIAIMASLFLIIGGMYLPNDFAAPAVRGVLGWSGLILLIGGNVVLVATSD